MRNNGTVQDGSAIVSERGAVVVVVMCGGDSSGGGWWRVVVCVWLCVVCYARYSDGDGGGAVVVHVSVGEWVGGCFWLFWGWSLGAPIHAPARAPGARPLTEHQRQVPKCHPVPLLLERHHREVAAQRAE